MTTAHHTQPKTLSVLVTVAFIIAKLNAVCNAEAIAIPTRTEKTFVNALR